MTYHIAQDYKYMGNDQWSWQVSIDASENELDDVNQVTWYLHHTFKNPVISQKNRNEKFKLERKGWGTFQIKAKLTLNDGSKEVLTHWLKLAYPASDKEVVTRGVPEKYISEKKKVFLSYGAEDQNLASEVRGKLEDDGYEVLDPINIKPGLPIAASIEKMVRESDLVMGLITSDFSSPSVLSELNKAYKSTKPTVAVIRQGIDQPYGLDKNLSRIELDLDSSNTSNELTDMLGKFTPQ